MLVIVAVVSSSVFELSISGELKTLDHKVQSLNSPPHLFVLAARPAGLENGAAHVILVIRSLLVFSTEIRLFPEAHDVPAASSENKTSDVLI